MKTKEQEIRDTGYGIRDTGYEIENRRQELRHWRETMRALSTHDDPVPSILNCGSLTTKVHTSSHNRYVARCPCDRQSQVRDVSRSRLPAL
jgi:hypothetical protein